jgi:hypothetical protein
MARVHGRCLDCGGALADIVWLPLYSRPPTGLDAQDMFGQLGGTNHFTCSSILCQLYLLLIHCWCPADGPRRVAREARNEVIDNSSGEESDVTSQLMVVAVSLIHEHNAMQRTVHRGSTKTRRGNRKRNRVGGHNRLYRDYFHPTDPVYTKTCSYVIIGCQETCSRFCEA